MFFGLETREMKNYQGDLTDILRASSSTTGGREVSEIAATVASVCDSDFWPSDPFMDQAVRPSSTPFGDPFSNMQDPLFLDQLNNNIPAGSSFFITSPSSSVDHHHVINTCPSPTTTTSSTVDDNNSTSTIVVANDHHRQKSFDHVEMMKTPCNIFSRIQISRPCGSPPVVVSSAMINANTSRDCLIENTVKPVQISSPRNLGIKRRKSQAKKVVCIPAPAAPNSKQSGEVVPSDLWAWRKYGQKPIKGSPYPRGYYRCSGSKGCSARKQVERSRTDPNMLVITYTSEHNHPWPTQKNSLAGSTRSQPPKTNTTTISRRAQAKEDQQKESSCNDNSASLSSIMPSTSTSVKEENNIEDFDNNLENIDDVEQFSDGFQSYRPSVLLPPDSSSDQGFFADLGELEADPLSLLFTIQGKESKDMDPFTLFDWSSGDTTNTQFDNK